jgi:ADP-ribose pyrophosphatase
MTDQPSRPPRPRPTRHAFERTRRLLDGFFKVDEYHGAFERFDGTMTPPQRLLVFERGDSVAALLYDPAHQEVILVDQFRLPVAVRAGGQFGWLLEPTAGIKPDDETVYETAIREIREETGYQVSSLTPIATFFPSPGGSTERIHLLFAEVRRLQQVETGGGVARTGEDIDVRRMRVTEFFARLRNREFEDAKLIIGGYWLVDRLAAMPRPSGAKPRSHAWRLVMGEQRGWFGTYTPEKRLGLVAGDIRKVGVGTAMGGTADRIDVWVNPLTSEMTLDKFTDRTISAAIRAAGARRYPDDKIREDLVGAALRAKVRAAAYVDVVGDELTAKLGGRSYVAQGKVLATSPGELGRSNGVKQVLHVSVAHGAPGQWPTVDVDTVARCVENVLRHVADEGRYESVLLPLIGTGEGALRVSEVAPIVVERTIDVLRQTPAARLKDVFILAYTDLDVEVVGEALKSRKAAFADDPSTDFTWPAFM